MIVDADVYLKHFGTKGMRWGYRKSRKEANVNLQKQYKLYSPSFDRLYDSVSQKTYKSLSKEEVKIAKGVQIARITTRKNEKLRDITYASFDPRDLTAYKSLIPTHGAFQNTHKDYHKSYEHVFEATKQLKGPSERARVDAFISLMDTPSIHMRNGTVITGRQYLYKQGYRKEVRQLTSTTLGLKVYRSFVSEQALTTPINIAYFNSLRKRGYNILSDDNDRGLLSSDPVILLDTSSKSIRPKTVRQLTKEEIVNAQKTLRLPKATGIQK